MRALCIAEEPLLDYVASDGSDQTAPKRRLSRVLPGAQSLAGGHLERVNCYFNNLQKSSSSVMFIIWFYKAMTERSKKACDENSKREKPHSVIQKKEMKGQAHALNKRKGADHYSGPDRVRTS